MYNKVVVTLDGSPEAECVLPHITTLAKKGLVKKLIFIKVTEGPHMPITDGRSVAFSPLCRKSTLERRSDAEYYLKNLASKLRFDGIEITWHALPYGEVSEMIARYVKEIKVDLIIMATHGETGILRWILGSVSERVNRLVSIPVILIKIPRNDTERQSFRGEKSFFKSIPKNTTGEKNEGLDLTMKRKD
jgi:nucleotide-binding universal stress UspA family protein